MKKLRLSLLKVKVKLSDNILLSFLASSVGFKQILQSHNDPHAIKCEISSFKLFLENCKV